jgi:hypothetical protein
VSGDGYLSIDFVLITAVAVRPAFFLNLESLNLVLAF